MITMHRRSSYYSSCQVPTTVVRPLQEVGCGKIEMHSLAQDGALQSAPLKNMLSDWNDLQLPSLAGFDRFRTQ